MAIFYFILGTLFIYLAITNEHETVWNPVTILLAVVATLDFVVGFRYLRAHQAQKKQPKE